ncbi:MAG: hypothetical protein IKC79_03655 [Clostridia bacterium]|nr:hypothetical protein [Clostridia bacterium]
MAKTQTNDIDFYAIQCDAADARAKIAEDTIAVQQAVSDGDVSRTLDTAIDLRNLGGVVDADTAESMESLILDKGTTQQKVDYAIEVASILGRSVSTIYDDIQGMTPEERAELVGLRTLKKLQATQVLHAMLPNTLVEEASEELENSNGMASMMV